MSHSWNCEKISQTFFFLSVTDWHYYLEALKWRIDLSVTQEEVCDSIV